MGTSLRPDASPSYSSQPSVPRDEILRLLYKSVARRRSLIKGKLKDGNGHFCAIGCLGDDCDNDRVRPLVAEPDFVDEVAAVNDKLSDRVSPKRRWQYVMKWLREEIAKLDAQSDRAGS